MAGIYNIDTIRLNPRVLDRASLFRPKSNYRLTIEPNEGEIIQASQYTANGMVLNLEGVGTNNHTSFPSRFQHTINDGVQSRGFYKVVFEDSENSFNELNFVPDEQNKVFIWIYFGENESTITNNLNTKQLSISIKRGTGITRDQVIDVADKVVDEITTFNF